MGQLKYKVERLCKSTRIERRAAILDELKNLDLEFELQPFEEGSNILCSIPGKSNRRLIISSHYDSAYSGYGVTFGAYDNAGGVVVLFELLKRLKEQELPATLQFLFFDHEERGQSGSLYYLSQMSSQAREEIIANLNIDGAGIGNLLAKESDFTLRVYPTDSLSFKHYGIESEHYFTLRKKDQERLSQGLLPEWSSILHTERDEPKRISEKSLEIAVKGMLQEINRKLNFAGG